MKLKKEVKYKNDKGQYLEFIPLKRIYKHATPGITHRVLINGVTKDWLSDDYKPGIKAALYFLEKHPPQGLPSMGQMSELINPEEICTKCNTYYAAKGELCQPCREYKEHTEIKGD